MSDKISRRDFLKVAGLGTAVSSVLTGCGSAARYVRRQPYSDMPEYTMTGTSVYFATTCGECSAGCGLIARTTEGRAHKVDGNPAHPVNYGNSCARGQATLEGLYNPDRVKGPGKQAQRGSGSFEAVDWTAAVNIVKEALQNNQPEEVGFLMGLFPDHLYDLVQLLAKGLGTTNVFRLGALGEFEARVTLMNASQKLLGAMKIPYFDLAHSAVTFSFGANFSETWLSPVSYSRAYGIMRQGHPGQRGYLVQFEPRMSQTAANADEWIPVNPGSEAFVAQALARLAGEMMKVSLPQGLQNVDVSAAAAASGVAEPELVRLAQIYADAPRKLAVPGGGPLGYSNGQSAAENILMLNILAGNLGQEGGIFFLPDNPLYPDLPHRPANLTEISTLIERMNSGQIKALFIHGTNPVFELPKALGFSEALQKVSQVISFSSFPDETARQSDYQLPDSTPLESWGYQKVVTGSDRTAISGLQPVVVPLYNTRPTADVLLEAVKEIGGSLAAAVNYSDEVDFLQKSIIPLNDQGGFYTAPDPVTFWSQWQQYGGWWKNAPDIFAPAVSLDANQPAGAVEAIFSGDEGQFSLHLLPFPSPNLGNGQGANYPWLQETPDPMTTVMWNSWVEINPDTALKLGVHSDDVVKISSPRGEVTAVVYEFPAIHPDAIAIPFGQGHTTLGRYADGRGINPLDLVDPKANEAGDLAFQATRVQVSKTGENKPLARYESRLGAYGPAGWIKE